jgi:hypothetical protein
LSGQDGACREDGDEDDDAVVGKRVPVRQCSAIAAAWVTLERVIGMR